MEPEATSAEAQTQRDKIEPILEEDRKNAVKIGALLTAHPEAVEQMTRPFIDAANKWEKILSVEPGSDIAFKLEKLNGKTLAELKAQAGITAKFLRGVANIPSPE
jgi:hypothetical protein